jgi:hypothetical protein
MSVETCWFCKGEATGQSYAKTLHHPKTLDRTEVAAPACDRCSAALKSVDQVQGVVSLILLIVGGVLSFLIANQILDAAGVVQKRLRAMLLLIGALMIPVIFLIVFAQSIVKKRMQRKTGMEQVDLEKHPRAVELIEQGYQWGDAPKKAAKS